MSRRRRKPPETLSPHERKLMSNQHKFNPAKIDMQEYADIPSWVQEVLFDMESPTNSSSYFISSKELPTQPAKAPPRNNLPALRRPIEEFLTPISHTLTWDSVIGNDEAKTALREAIEASTTHANLYTAYDMTPAKGVVLHGPPGCGKTLFAKAAAAAVSNLAGGQAELILINGSSVQSPYVGETEKRIAAVFAYAREYHRVYGRPLTIFVDEADALLLSRDRAPHYQILNVSAFLAEMDGMNANGAFVILATNRVETLDEALLRDGRCSRKIKITRPGLAEARAILEPTLTPLAFSHPDDILDLILDYFVSPDRVVQHFTALDGKNRKHTFPLTLANIMNGAMLAGLADRAKGYAFRRDVASGTFTGLTLPDFQSAIEELVRDNSSIQHTFAIEELLLTLPLREKERLN